MQGEVVHWLACSLYAACRKGSTPTVGKGLMEGNCVSLTRILRTAKLRSVTVSCDVPHNVRIQKHLANCGNYHLHIEGSWNYSLILYLCKNEFVSSAVVMRCL